MTAVTMKRKTNYFICFSRSLLLMIIISLLVRGTISETSNNNRNAFGELSNSDSVSCSPTETPFRFELETDQFPESISWKLIDVNTNGMVIYADQRTYKTPGTLHNQTFCLDTVSCHQFTINDTFGDGVCCQYGTGWYKIFYDDNLIMEGGDFDHFDTSKPFGVGCPTPSPSMSPSVSFVPTTSTSPTALASFQPTSLPSLSSSPSALPTSSLLPSSGPSQESGPFHIETVFPPIEFIDLVVLDQYDRRYFPKRIDPKSYPEGIFPYQPIPDCRYTIGRVGCVAIPRSLDYDNAPHWAGNIYTKPPSCDKRKKRCEMGIPMSMNTSNLLSEPFRSINPFQGELLDGTSLPGHITSIARSLVAADVNNDGLLDIIIGNYKETNHLLINVGNGSFSEIIDLPDSGKFLTSSIVAADMNNDGMVDIIVGNMGHENQLLINAGNGGFMNAINLPGDSLDTTRSIAIADVNNDGKLDIIIGNDNKKNQLLINAGNGSFSEIIDLPGRLPTSFVIAADVNDDGMVDIIVGNFNDFNQLLLNKGGNTLFKDAVNLLDGGRSRRTTSIAVADINNDGMVDIVIGNDIQNNQLLVNDGYGYFNDGVDLPGGDLRTRTIAVADMDNDGMVDIIVGNTGEVNQLLMNYGGMFEEAIDSSRGTFRTRCLVAADMNNDGIVDIIVGNEEESNQKFMNKVGAGDFVDMSTTKLPGSASNSRAIISADLNNDGILDIIVGNEGAPNQLLMNAGAGLFEDPDNLDGYFTTYDIAAADMNNDGWIDILVGNYKQPNQLLFNLGNGKFGSANDLPGGTLGTRSIIAVDINNDGMLDIILGNKEVPNQLLINRGGGNFSDPPIDLPGGAFVADDTIIFDTNSIVAADMNNDGMLDIIVGNERERNQLLLNTGNGNFFEHAIDLPGSLFTSSIAVADVNNDGMLDIVVGNWLSVKNQVLINKGNGTFDDAVDLPGGAIHTQSITVADINNDGMVDILVGNKGQKNQLLINEGDGSFKNATDLPGSTMNTYSLAVADGNSDGMLDILVGNYDMQPNQFIPYSSCASSGSGVRLHSKGWCVRCPSFMGHNIHASACQECHPDFIQQPGSIKEQCTFQCPLQERKLGKDECFPCADGSFFNQGLERIPDDFSTWNRPRCQLCSPGTYALNMTAINKCFECTPGTYQPESGASRCMDCPVGTFQTNFKQDKCNPCAAGGYCDAVNKLNGGFTPCPPGTFNDKPGKSDKSACQKCPAGTYSIETGANSTNSCHDCAPGTFSDKPGVKQCKLCTAGTFQDKSGSISCDPCNAGMYADQIGFRKCIECPFRLSSMGNARECSFCADKYYLSNVNTTSTQIFQNPSKYCLPCPPNALCLVNTSILNLSVPLNYWRHSEITSKIYPCKTGIKNNNACIGTAHYSTKLTNIAHHLNTNTTGIYCKEGHTGPLCEVCVEKGYYFSHTEGECNECRPFSLLVLRFLGIILGIAGLVVALALILIRRIPSILDVVSSLSLQAKAKLLVSFYQVLTHFDDIYGVTIASELIHLFDIFKYFSFDFLRIIDIPTSCIGSFKYKLIFSAAWPFIIIVLGGAFTYGAYKIKEIWINADNDGGQAISNQGNNAMDSFKKWSIQWFIIMYYFALPLVSRGIFDSEKCQAFQTDDNDTPTIVSYLVEDLRIQCNSREDSQYANIQVTFWFLFAVWDILTPLGFLILLASIGPSIRSKSITPLADACRFLWQDYDASMWFWDIVDVMRKIILNGYIMFIDPAEGSNKMLRLVIAIIVSVLYQSILLAYRPYKRIDDYNLAFLSNFLLICCFVLGIILKICDEDTDEDDKNAFDGNGACNRFIGYSLDSLSASIVVVCLTLGLLIITICLVVILAINKIRAPTVRITSSGYIPNLELPQDCSYHIFMSHVWATGQARTHAIARKMQLLLPGLKIWLDVDNLNDISKLEECVEASAVIVLFYSKNYFRSKNCRREIYAAMKFDKPIVLLYEGDPSMIEVMEIECIRYCGKDDADADDIYTSADILEKLLGNEQLNNALSESQNEPIQWLNEGSFSAATLKKIYRRVLGQLPYYKSRQRVLQKGIQVPGEVGLVSLQSPINLLVYENNQGCSDLAGELKSMLPRGSSDLITVTNASGFVHHHILKTKGEEEHIDYIDTSIDINDKEEVEYDLAATSIMPFDEPTYFLLYLNQYTFQGNEQGLIELTTIVQSCLDHPDINIVLVHEKDVLRGGCNFDVFFNEAPEELINPPYTLFKDIAIPLYSNKEYRDVSLRQILCKMGAK